MVGVDVDDSTGVCSPSAKAAPTFPLPPIDLPLSGAKLGEVPSALLSVLVRESNGDIVSGDIAMEPRRLRELATWPGWPDVWPPDLPISV